MDLTLVPNGDPRVAEVNSTNCYNGTLENPSEIGFNLLYTTQELTAQGTTSGSTLTSTPTLLGILAISLMTVAGTMI